MKKKSFLLVLALLSVSMLAMAQAITGVVLDASNGEPIIGANVVEKGTTNGTITDFDGNFVLTVQPGAVLQISYMGYRAQELEARPNMRVELSEDSELLDEVVVVGYGTVRKNDATGSVTAMKPDEMNKGLTTNAQDMLQGKIAGVNVVASDGTPGGAGSITIRGGASLNASNSPLIVIDGLAMDNNGIQGVANPLSMVNPADIESFTVLKDASATAIYGSRASNGVIIITTKKGAKGSKPKFTYNGNVSFGILTNRLETLTGDELRQYATDLAHKPNKTATLGTENTNWQDQIYRTAISTDHNLSISGGTAHMPYRASIGYTLQNGTLKTSQMQRVTADVSLSPSFLKDHLNFNLNAKGMYSYNRYADGAAVGSALTMDPTMPVMHGAKNAAGDVLVADDVIDTWFGGYYQRVKNGKYGDPEWPYTVNQQSTANPLSLLQLKNDRANSGVFIGNLEADYKIHGFEDLRIHANFGADYSYGKQVTSISPYSYTNHYYGYEGYTEKSKYNLQFSAYAQYYKDWEDAAQHFDVMVGYESQYFYWKSFTDGAGTYQLTNNDKTLAGKDYNRYTRESNSDNALMSFYGRLNWNGWNQILLTATFRADGSSRFARYDSKGKNARWGLFPSVALGWKIKETLLRNVNAINDFKLRLGYGITGQQDIGYDYYYMPTYVYGQEHAYYPVGDGNTVEGINGYYYTYRPGAYNTDLTWEKTTTYNVGIDFAVLNNRVTMNLDYYYRVTKDLIAWVDVPAGTNFKNRVVSNIGSLRNQGVEYAINAVAIDRKNFKWDLGFNVAWNDNKITSLIEGKGDDYYVPVGNIGIGTGNMIQANKVGEAANSFYVYESHLETDANGNKVFYVVDRNKDGQITPDDKYIYQSPAAKVTLGFNTKFQFYGFDLGFNLRANIGNYVYNEVLAGNLQWVEGGKVYQSQNGGYHGVLRNDFDLYYKTGVRSDQTYGLVYDKTTDSYKYEKFSDWYMADYFVENASFLRIDNITLGYSFQKPKISGRAYITVSNPCVISGYSGLDPEIGGGIDNSIYPRSMTTVAGISLQF